MSFINIKRVEQEQLNLSDYLAKRNLSEAEVIHLLRAHIDLIIMGLNRND